MIRRSQKRRPRPSEEGYMLVAIIFMLAILILSMAVAIPRVRDDIRRDREVETMERGKQYIRAVQLYYRKFGAYPPNIDALVKTNNIRFLRKKYVDPTTGKDEWKPVLFGQNKTPQAMGFFGQPLAASTLAGTGPGGNAIPGAIAAGGTGIGSPTGGGLFNATPTSGSSTDAGTTSTPTTGAPAGSTGGTDANGNPTSGTGNTGTTTTGGTTNAGSTTTSGTTGSGTTGIGSSGPTFGGGGIIGFSPQSPKQSILVYKKKNHYNEWEFLYSPLMDQQNMSGGNTGTVGQPAGSTTTPIGGSSTPTPTPSPSPPAGTTPAPQQ